MRNGMCDSLLSGAAQKNETADCAATVSSSHFYRSNKTKSFLSRRGVGIPLEKKAYFHKTTKKGRSEPESGNKLKTFLFTLLSSDELDGVALVQIKLKGDHFSRVSLKQESFDCVIGYITKFMCDFFV